MPAPRSVTKHDVALAEVRRKAARELAVIRGVVVAIWIAASALPILAVQRIIEPLAGETTIVNVDVVVSVVVTLSIAINIGQAAKLRSQRKELRRQRERIARLEGGES